MESIGKQIGKAVDNFSIKNDYEDKAQIKLTFDYTTASNVDIVSWLNANRRIALQRPARAMDKAELESMNNITIMATDAGKKVKTKAERIKEAKATIEALKAYYPNEYDDIVKELDNEYSLDNGGGLDKG